MSTVPEDMTPASDLTDAELAEIEARAAADGVASVPGPWWVGPALTADDQTFHLPVMYREPADEGGETFDGPVCSIDYDARGFTYPHADNRQLAVFIAAARADVPRLVAALRAAREENAALRAWIDETDTVLAGALGDRHVDQPPAVGVRQVVDHRDYWQRIAKVQLDARDRVERVLDAALGSNEEDGTGEGMAADVALVVRQRDEARAAVARAEKATSDALNLARANEEAHRSEVRQIVAGQNAEALRHIAQHIFGGFGPGDIDDRFELTWGRVREALAADVPAASDEPQPPCGKQYGCTAERKPTRVEHHTPECQHHNDSPCDHGRDQRCWFCVEDDDLVMTADGVRAADRPGRAAPAVLPPTPTPGSNDSPITILQLAGHGYTGHAHRCCKQASADLRTRTAASCGGPNRCEECSDDVDDIHAGRNTPAVIWCRRCNVILGMDALDDHNREHHAAPAAVVDPADGHFCTCPRQANHTGEDAP